MLVFADTTHTAVHFLNIHTHIHTHTHTHTHTHAGTRQIDRDRAYLTSWVSTLIKLALHLMEELLISCVRICI